ncbi:hypothetical protein [Pseudodesulfovibrio portus]|uniref:Uncharacterized protein n=1 Tax=Pseudodesulfovibrio portus TaxID=231439 RepID=A0ABN6RSG1_9BACT|nr:hypothetical protein [Pseudodesulfovibrio portus]BDQ33629.1 hypothetical protein JCM14722_11710 [Pseudodesulfovibrio portus]
MISRQQFSEWVEEALLVYNGRATILQVSKYIWENYERELRRFEETFFKWQYDVRWAAKMLREKGVMKSVDDCPKGIWELI